jgi:hypothetical protein
MIYLIILAIVAPISFLWVRGIDDMNTQYPDYKGEDFFEEFKDEENKK